MEKCPVCKMEYLISGDNIVYCIDCRDTKEQIDKDQILIKKFKDDEYQKELKEVLEKFGDNDYYNLDGDMEIFYDEDKKWYLRYDSGYGKLEIKFRTVKNLIKDREDSCTKK